MAAYVKLTSSHRLKLTRVSTRSKTEYRSKKQYNKRLEKNRAALEEYQELLYAGHAKAMLIVFQGMDTSGKDGAIKHIMSGVNPQGCQVVSFKQPTPVERDHDFLWRSDRVMPERGKIGIFNRSYYEETLVTRVHPKLLADEKLPTGNNHGRALWKNRYRDIVNHEHFLHRQGYEIVKFFIHVSKDEQKRRLLDRFSDPKKQWKISEGDVHERSFWKEYQNAYEECLQHTASKSSPWYIVPGDDKENARIIISQILVDRFDKMRLKYPKLGRKEKLKLKTLKSELSRE